MNTKGTYFPAVAAVLLFAVAFCLQIRFQSHLTADYAAQVIGDHIHREIESISQLIGEKEALQTQIDDPDEKLAESYPPFFIFDGEKLDFWSNPSIAEPGRLRLAAPDGVYEDRYNQYVVGALRAPLGKDVSVVYAIPLNNLGKGGRFDHISKSIPANLDLNQKEGSPFYSNEKGQHILYARAHENPQMTSYDLMWLIFFYSLALIAVATLITQQLPAMRTRWGDRVALSSFVASVLALRVVLLTTTANAPLEALPIFDESLISPALGVSLADLIVNSVLILWVTIVLINQIEPKIAPGTFNWQKKIGWSAAGYLVILASLAALAWFSTRLILDSQIDFNFESVLDLNTISIVAILCIIMIVFSIFLWSIEIASWVHAIGFTSRKKIAVGITVLLCSLPLVHQLIPSVPIMQFGLVVLTFVLLLDLFTEARRTNFTWIVVWLVVLSGFSSVLLYKINIDKDTARRQLIAQVLIDSDDHVALQEISLFAEHLHREALLDTVTTAQIASAFGQYRGYLSTYYEVDFPASASITEGHLIVGTARNIWRQREQLEGYLTWLEVGDRRILTGFKKRKNPKQTAVHIGSTINFKGIDGLEQYEYAIYGADGVCIERSSPDYPLKMFASLGQTVEAKVQFSDHRSELVYTNGQHTVSVGRKLYGVIKPLSLFSYLFIIVVVAMLCMLFLNCLVTYLPQNFCFTFNNGLSLRNRIQISVLSLILLSFVIIGIATVLYFQNAEHKNNLDRIKRTASSLQEEIQFHYQDQQSLISQHALEHLALKYQTHINLYDTEGRLTRTSQYSDDLDNSLVGSLISYTAMSTLRSLSQSMIPPIPSEEGQEPAYIALNQDGTLLGFASLPLHDSLNDAGERVKEFMSTLLNVYVLLLLVAIFLALAVSRSITRPITELVNRIKDFRLGTSQQPLPWHSNDELGILINEYNQMIFKLDESAELLAQTEREVAWREMAKQVAHEIKNPLTPMKLSIQHLQYAMGKADLIESRQLVKRVAITLIEQIDNLSKIAAEFSSFAKMPKPETQCIVLNDLVASVHDLFKKRDDMEFNLYVPIDELTIMADKSHLLRVLNNLIKNAVQAIPASRRGIIDIRLERQGNKALLQVTDNGKGISDEMKEKVFYPNFTTKTSGTGLGLAISKNIIESFNGRIYFETEENVGTTFFFEVPLAQESDLAGIGELKRTQRGGPLYSERAAAMVDPISAGD